MCLKSQDQPLIKFQSGFLSLSEVDANDWAWSSASRYRPVALFWILLGFSLDSWLHLADLAILLLLVHIVLPVPMSNTLPVSMWVKRVPSHLHVWLVMRVLFLFSGAKKVFPSTLESKNWLVLTCCILKNEIPELILFGFKRST